MALGTTHWLSAIAQNHSGPGFALAARAHDVALTPSPAITGAKLLSFSSGGNPYLMLYRTNASTTVAALSGSGAQTEIGTFDSDWKHIVSFTHESTPYLLFTKEASGQSVIYQVSPGGLSNGVAVGNFDPSWKQIVSFTHEGNPYLLFYREGSGQIVTWQVGPTGSPASA